MKSENYVKAGRVKIGVVDIVAKFKSCGKENCSQCPHGPVWYAYVPAFDSVDRKRTEIYLGRWWIHEGLRQKVAPAISATPRREFLAEIETVVRHERIAFLESEQKQVAQAIVDVVTRHQKEVEKLRRDEAGIRKELAELKAKR